MADVCLPTMMAAVAYPIRPIAAEHTPRARWWLACAECARLVTATRRNDLAHRALDLRTAADPFHLDQDMHLAFIRKSHDRFWPARDGEPVSLEVLL